MRAAQVRNYRFFDAPCGVVVCLERCLAQMDVLSVGMWVQAFCLGLGERGVACCVSASVAGYGEVSCVFECEFAREVLMCECG